MPGKNPGTFLPGFVLFLFLLSIPFFSSFYPFLFFFISLSFFFLLSKEEREENKGLSHDSSPKKSCVRYEPMRRYPFLNLYSNPVHGCSSSLPLPLPLLLFFSLSLFIYHAKKEIQERERERSFNTFLSQIIPLYMYFLLVVSLWQQQLLYQFLSSFSFSLFIVYLPSHSLSFSFSLLLFWWWFMWHWNIDISIQHIIYFHWNIVLYV